MDACHDLLGRPWMYDRKAMHNGFLNKYAFTKGGNKITVVPLSPSKLYKSKPQKKPEHSSCLLTFSEPPIKASNHDFRAFREWMMNVQEEPKTPLLDHPIVKSLIHQFCHLFTEETPIGLPPKRDIQRHIVLISGFILPNKPAYTMNPKETMEIPGQVGELMSKGDVS